MHLKMADQPWKNFYTWEFIKFEMACQMLLHVSYLHESSKEINEHRSGMKTVLSSYFK